MTTYLIEDGCPTAIRSTSATFGEFAVKVLTPELCLTIEQAQGVWWLGRERVRRS